MKQTPLTGIDDMAFHIPRLYLPIEILARHRNLDCGKLKDGLGLEAMSLTDVHEDAATMAANAARKLIEKNKLSPQEIGRIYVGSESLVDGAKPLASYVLAMLSDYFNPEYGPHAFLHTDVVDMTFACIGGVDALHNTLDWVRLGENRTAIVICTDNARYELGSTGEYTQGAGAVALLIRQKPRLLAIEEPVGVAAVSEHDFFKPLRRISRDKLPDGFAFPFLSDKEAYLDIHKIFPVFDGPYSNTCYANRLKQAYMHFSRLKARHKLSDWGRIVFHLPYAFHGKRMFPEIFLEEYIRNPELRKQLLEEDPSFPENKSLKTVAKTPLYQQFVREKIEKGQRASSLTGNLYTGSVFLSLMSLLESDLRDGTPLENMRVGFCTYGSGSKSKVFEGVVQKEWKPIVDKFGLFDALLQRTPIDFDVYEALHSGSITESILPPEDEFYLKSVATAEPLYGVRTYAFAAPKAGATKGRAQMTESGKAANSDCGITRQSVTRHH
ncbi:MAG: hydroxymethylglutaryl-CoA synthase [Chitinophagales bacterium]|nr:MAG: hydroxymethylglutaryl-CoA synthase [Chitinophagales bacterium]